MRRVAFALISLFFLVATIQNAYAADIDITELDDRLGDALGVGAFGGGLILSVIFLFVFLGLLGMVMKRAPSGLMVMFMSSVVLSMCIAFGWFPVFSIVLVILLVSLLIGTKIVGSFR